MLDNVDDGGRNMDTSLIDLNARPQNVHGQTSNNQVIFYIPLTLLLNWTLVSEAMIWRSYFMLNY